MRRFGSHNDVDLSSPKKQTTTQSLAQGFIPIFGSTIPIDTSVWTQTVIDQNITADGNTGTLGGYYGKYNEIYMELNCDSVTNNGSLAVIVQTSSTADKWKDILVFENITSSKLTDQKTISRYSSTDIQGAVSDRMRVRWVVTADPTAGGSPTFTNVELKWTCKK